MEEPIFTILLIVLGVLIFFLIIMAIMAHRRLVAYFQRMEERDIEKLEIEKKKLELMKQKPKKE